MTHFKAGDKVIANSATVHVVRVEDMGIFFGALLVGLDATTGKAVAVKGDTAVHADTECDWCYPR